MTLFQEATNQQAFLKMGIFGFEGSGKTFTAALTAVALWAYIKSQKPVAWFDTETGTDYVKPLFDKSGIKLVTVKSRALKTLGAAIQEARELTDIMVVDSLTHPYRELCSTYVKQKKDGTKFIRMQDWQPIKEAWREEFAEPYVNTKLHFIWCARAKNVWEDVLDEMATDQSGRDQFKSQVVGTAARAETESGYEPSLLVEMTKEYLREGGRYIRRALVVKDRFSVIDSATFDFEAFNPARETAKHLLENKTFKAFLPHIKLLNIGGEHVGFQEESSASLFDATVQKSLAHVRHRREVAVESLENGLTMVFPSTSAAHKQARFAILAELAGTTAWAEIQTMPAEKLEWMLKIVSCLADRITEGFTFQNNLELKKEVRTIAGAIPLELPQKEKEAP